MRFALSLAVVSVGVAIAKLYGTTHHLGWLFISWSAMITGFAIMSMDEEAKRGNRYAKRR